MTAATLDHIVINTLRDMDAAAQVFAALGFTLTPLGRHSLGSINHLMMTPGPYLELVGVPATGLQRQDVLDSPFGLNGLVLRSHDADATYKELQPQNLPVLPPSSFSRPVTIDGTAVEAKFRTVRIPGETFPEGRVYFCEHLTPEYVWREEWLSHPNGFLTIDHMAIESGDPAAAAALYAKACGTAAQQENDDWTIQLDGFSLRFITGPAPRFLSLGLTFKSLDEIETRACALAGAEWHRETPDLARLTIPGLTLHLDCRRAS